VDITDAVKPAGNKLEIDVINLWPNRLLGDRALPPAERVTRTNALGNKFLKPLPSGLLGPVRVLEAQNSIESVNVTKERIQ
jgi:hypothetical protein